MSDVCKNRGAKAKANCKDRWLCDKISLCQLEKVFGETIKTIKS